MNSIEEAWEETLLVPPPFVVPMWVRGRNQETAAVSKLPKRSEQNWRVARHGSLQTEDEKAPKWRVARHGSHQLNQRKASNKASGSNVSLPVYIHFCETRTAEENPHGEATEQFRWKRGEERRREKEIR